MTPDGQWQHVLGRTCIAGSTVIILQHIILQCLPTLSFCSGEDSWNDEIIESSCLLLRYAEWPQKELRFSVVVSYFVSDQYKIIKKTARCYLLFLNKMIHSLISDDQLLNLLTPDLILIAKCWKKEKRCLAPGEQMEIGSYRFPSGSWNMRSHFCLSTELPAWDKCLPLWWCVGCIEGECAGRKDSLRKPHCSIYFQSLCSDEEECRHECVCMCVCGMGQQVERNLSAACIHGYVTEHNLAPLCDWVGGCVCRWVGLSDRDRQRSTSVWPAGDPATFHLLFAVRSLRKIICTRKHSWNLLHLF